ncbi:GNAT family N-acetyltransferase [Actinoplanes teichomyceticus]|uniref:Putative N-acetyltransferase YhbS n=1 Tax=Actinoplanes teichomyceticus TaxID=1867 RepID=A0A561VI77_ACTTI|nr:GNAT family N-acetyltransferase [Actinoplanes teichomyceticus]TWG11323.1 putative N-acetyltransferase YhbS [Actinoplanes teichomyceticus]GIF16354.1 hypothetical protein Ate01nite_63860 [Actinoplanes teichomyceticus]
MTGRGWATVLDALLALLPGGRERGIRARVAGLTVRRAARLHLGGGRCTGWYEGDRLRHHRKFPTHAGAPAAPRVVARPGRDPLPCTTVRAERVRPIDAPDWPAIAALESGAYAELGLSESPDALRSRAHPATSFVLDAGGRVGGYLLALPYPPARCPDLSGPEGSGFHGGNLHLHDIVVDAELRGRGWGRRLVRHLVEEAQSRSYDRISLVAIDGTAGFWSARGFRPHPEVEVPASYGPGAVYMSRDLNRPAPPAA